MLKDKLKKPSIPEEREPILAINEFEEETESLLDLAKKEAEKIIQEAKDKASQIIFQPTQSFKVLESEYLKKVEEEIRKEREELMLKLEGELKRMETDLTEKIRQAVDFVLEQVIPKG